MAMNDIPEQNLDQWAKKGGPPALKNALGLFGSTPAVSHSMDQQILAAARAQSARRHRMRWMIRYAIGSVAAAAAAILIAINTPHRSARMKMNSDATPLASSEDINRDGKLDILDAFFMARKVAGNEPMTSQWDFNHDGIVDNKDVDVVALAAVKIKSPGAQ